MTVSYTLKRPPLVLAQAIKEARTRTPLDRIANDIHREFAAWSAALPKQSYEPGNYKDHRFPDPTDTHGLPGGFTIFARYRDFLHEDTDLFLTRRTAGGVVMFRHEFDLMRTAIYWTDLTLADMYTHVLECVPQSNRDRYHPAAEPISVWLKDILLSMYDLNDSTEASEHMLFALGGTLNIPPRAAC